MESLKAFHFSDTMPELNYLVIKGRAGRLLEVPLGIKVGKESITLNNYTEFEVKEVKPMLFRITHKDKSILIGSNRTPKIARSHVLVAPVICQTDNPPITTDDNILYGSRKGNTVTFRSHKLSVSINLNYGLWTVKLLDRVGNVTKVLTKLELYSRFDAFRAACRLIGKDLYYDLILHQDNK